MGKDAGVSLLKISSGVGVILAARDLGYGVEELLTMEERMLHFSQGEQVRASNAMANNLKEGLLYKKMWDKLDCDQFGSL